MLVVFVGLDGAITSFLTPRPGFVVLRMRAFSSFNSRSDPLKKQGLGCRVFIIFRPRAKILVGSNREGISALELAIDLTEDVTVSPRTAFGKHIKLAMFAMW